MLSGHRKNEQMAHCRETQRGSGENKRMSLQSSNGIPLSTIAGVGIVEPSEKFPAIFKFVTYLSTR